MSGINKIKKGVTVGGSSTPYGGYVIGLQYSVSFEGPSSLSVTIANDSGKYDTPVLNGESPTTVAFGSSSMSVLPVSYRKSMGAAGRTLTVNFEDMGTKYLDKTLVLLRDQHLTNKISSCAIILGDMYAEDESGVQRRYSGVYKSGVTRVAYEVADLGLAMAKHGIPMSGGLQGFLSKFKNNISFLRTDIGDLRSVIASVGTDLGFVPFWNNGKGQAGGGSGQGFLDYIRFENDQDLNVINGTIGKVASACNIEDDSYEVTIKNSTLKGGIGHFDVNPSSNMSRKSKFTRFQFRETITSPHTGGEVEIRDNMEMALLMRAAQMGPEFYKNYVVLKLCCAYTKDLAARGNTYFTTLGRREKKAVWNRLKWVGLSIQRESTRADGFPLNMVENTAVNALYKGTDFDLIPTVYSVQYDTCENWRDSKAKGPYFGTPSPPLDDWVGADTRYEDVYEDETFLEELREAFTLKDVFGEDEIAEASAVAPSEFIGVAFKKTKAMFEFLANPGDDPVFKEILWLSENYGRWFSLAKGGTGGALILQNSFTLRNYSEDVTWVFSDLAATDTPLEAIYKFTLDGAPNFEDRGNYKLAKGGQSKCAGSTLTLSGYRCIVGMHILLSEGANAQPRRTTCGGGIKDKFRIGSIYRVESGPNFKSFALEWMVVRTSKLLKKPPSGGGGGAAGGGGGGKCADKAGSIPSEWYDFQQDYRSNCDAASIIRPGVGGGRPTSVNRSRDKYKYDTDKDYGVLLHKLGVDPSVFGGDVAIAFSQYDKSDAVGAGDLWMEGWPRADSAYMAIEIIQIGPQKVRINYDDNATVDSPLATYSNQWATDEHIDLDYWDYRLFSDTELGINLADVQDDKIIAYSFSVDDLLQSIRCSYIPATNFAKVTSLAVEDVKFDIGELLLDEDDNPDGKAPPYQLCEEDSAGSLDIQLASNNLVRIMQSYVDNNISPSISREYVISGFGFRDTAESSPYLPTIGSGLESVSISIGEQGIKTTVKIGNKRRMKASKEMLAAAVVSGLAGGSRSRRVPNNVTTTLSTKFQTRM